MATTIKDNGKLKDKKVIPSSNYVPPSRPTGFPGNNKPNQRKNLVPSYLKPTFSSRPHHAHHQPPNRNTKNVVTATTSKPTLISRRSFDKTPPYKTMAHLQSISRDITKHKLSTKAASSTSASVMRVVNELKKSVDKAPLPSSKVMKKSASMPIKNVSRDTAKSQGDKLHGNVVESEHRINNDVKICEPEKIVNVLESAIEVPVDENVPKIEEKGQIGDAVEEAQVNSMEDDQKPIQESHTVVSKEQITITQVEEDRNNEELPEKESDMRQEVEEESAKTNQSETVKYATEIGTEQEQDRSVEEDVEVSRNNEKNEENNDIAVIQEVKHDEEEKNNVLLEREVIEEENHNNETNEGENHTEIDDAKPAKTEERASTEAKKKQTVPGKNESPATYNDVIEETKNKLMEKRKNKVKALVGAFEAVIDYESAGSK